VQICWVFDSRRYEQVILRPSVAATATQEALKNAHVQAFRERIGEHESTA